MRIVHGVGKEGREIADLHVAVSDEVPAEPDDRDRGEVEEQHDRRGHHGEQPGDLQGGHGEVVVGLGEAPLLVLGADEGADDPDAGEVLAQDALMRSIFTCMERRAALPCAR
jgi:hypothetical protein